MARRFRFPFERLARVRAIEERIARAGWAAAERAALESEAAAEEVRRELREGRDALGQGLARGALHAREVLCHHQALAALGRALIGRREHSFTRRAQAQRLAEDWGQRRAAAEALSRLRERAVERHGRKVGRQEAFELDELALVRSRAGTQPPDLDSSTGHR